MSSTVWQSGMKSLAPLMKRGTFFLAISSNISSSCTFLSQIKQSPLHPQTCPSSLSYSLLSLLCPQVCEGLIGVETMMALSCPQCECSVCLPQMPSLPAEPHTLAAALLTWPKEALHSSSRTISITAQGRSLIRQDACDDSSISVDIFLSSHMQRLPGSQNLDRASVRNVKWKE